MLKRPTTSCLGRALLGLALSACGPAEDTGNMPGEPAERADHCPSSAAGPSSQPLINGDPRADYLALSDAQRGAIGRLRAPHAEDTCTGVRVAAQWVLTARHCAALGQALFSGADGGQSHVVEWVLHPEQDLALARLSLTCPSARVLPIAEPDAHSETLVRATLAGYGLNAQDRLGQLAFLVESVVAIDAQSVTVDGFGRSGACVGDSGGPLLIRDRRGQVALLAVLALGAESCLGRDVYTRVDALSAWLRSDVELPSAPDGCGQIDQRGRCFEQQAVWCAAGELVSAVCSADLPCGFDQRENGFRCARSPRCTGDEFGYCDGTQAKRCAGGVPVAESCAAVDLSCGYDPKSGSATCR